MSSVGAPFNPGSVPCHPVPTPIKGAAVYSPSTSAWLNVQWGKTWPFASFPGLQVPELDQGREWMWNGASEDWPGFLFQPSPTVTKEWEDTQRWAVYWKWWGLRDVNHTLLFGHSRRGFSKMIRPNVLHDVLLWNHLKIECTSNLQPSFVNLLNGQTVYKDWRCLVLKLGSFVCKGFIIRSSNFWLGLRKVTELTECHIRRFPNGKVDLNKAKCHREHPSGH